MIAALSSGQKKRMGDTKMNIVNIPKRTAYSNRSIMFQRDTYGVFSSYCRETNIPAVDDLYFVPVMGTPYEIWGDWEDNRGTKYVAFRSLAEATSWAKHVPSGDPDHMVMWYFKEGVTYRKMNDEFYDCYHRMMKSGFEDFATEFGLDGRYYEDSQVDKRAAELALVACDYIEDVFANLPKWIRDSRLHQEFNIPKLADLRRVAEKRLAEDGIEIVTSASIRFGSGTYFCRNRIEFGGEFIKLSEAKSRGLIRTETTGSETTDFTHTIFERIIPLCRGLRLHNGVYSEPGGDSESCYELDHTVSSFPDFAEVV